MGENWKNEIIDQMRENLSRDGASVERKDYMLGNRETDSICIDFPDSPYTMRFALDKYGDLVDAGIPTADIASALVTEAREGHKYAPMLGQAEELKKNLYVTISNAEKNPELLNGRPYLKLEDLVVTPRCRVSQDQRGMASFAVTDTHLGLLQLTREEAMETAFRNTICNGFEIRTMGEMLRGMIAGSLPEEMENEMLDTPVPSDIYVVTTPTKIEGAVALACPEVMEQAAEKIGENFFVLPSSRHELILVPESKVDDPKELQTMVSEINQAMVSREDYLSDNIYRFNGITKAISMVSTTIEEKVTDLVDNLSERLSERLEKSEGRRR